MELSKPFHRKKIVVIFLACILIFSGLSARVAYLMVFRAAHYSELALDLHQRERKIKAKRGRILDRNGIVLADNQPVCTISVIHNQIRDPNAVIALLCSKLGMSEETVRKRVEKVSSIERIKTNVEKSVGDTIRDYGLEGVKVDEDYKRYYPYGSLASKVLGFTGGDNQGIIGLEVKYEEVLKGENGKILTITDARGVEIDQIGESRKDPVPGENLKISLDIDIQQYAQQAALKVMEEKQATRVSILLMNPQNGEIYACVNVPEFDLNDPFTLNTDVDTTGMTQQEKQDLLNQMWRNPCLNDTYEPGSTFKIITMSAGLEAGVVSVNDRFYCPGYKVVDDRRIHCARRTGHGSQNFVEGAQNSCNPVFIDVGLRLGVDNYYKYFTQFGVKGKTGIDLPGEAATIMHKKENMGLVELATVSFGQSFQITPLQLLRAVSAVINGGNLVTPHLGMYTTDAEGNEQTVFNYPVKSGAISSETSETMKELLGLVVSEGTGKNGQVAGYSVGGKTATSQKLPRGSGKYIASFIGFAPVDDPKIIGIILIDEPVGTYYGGTIAAPVMSEIYQMVLPYLFPEDKQEEIQEETGDNLS